MTALDYQTPRRMELKRKAITLPDLHGKTVLDVGCDAGEWCWQAAEAGASDVLGLDRGREIRGRGFVDVASENRERAQDNGYSRCRFETVNLGKQWHEFGKFDVVLCLSMYHHFYECCGDHIAVWFWLWRHCKSELIWEGPVDDSDVVVRANVSSDNRKLFRRDVILNAAAQYFRAEYIGPALHEPTRQVWRLIPLERQMVTTGATMLAGAGGATPAFEYANGRRIGEIERALGIRPVSGSLNLSLEGPFDWNIGYYRAQILDVADRANGLKSEWLPRWARFYPLTINGIAAYAFRFEGERYNPQFMELIAVNRLRDMIAGPKVAICRR